MQRVLKIAACAAVLTASCSSAFAAGSPGRSEIESAWKHDKFAYVLFQKESNSSVDEMRKTFAGTRPVAAAAKLVEVSISDAKEAELVAEYDLSRAPMPLLVALAPNGAVTGAWPLEVTAEQLQEGLVSRGASECLKSLQNGRVVIACIQLPKSADAATALAAAKECQADARFGDAIDIVSVDPSKKDEASFLTSLGATGTQSVTVILAPPGRALGRFEGAVTGEKLIEAITSAQEGCCPGGQCGPNGCCPGGKCTPAE